MTAVERYDHQDLFTDGVTVLYFEQNACLMMLL